MPYETSDVNVPRDHMNRDPGRGYLGPLTEREGRERLRYRLDMPPVVSELSPYFEGNYSGVSYS